ncbi:ArsA family ATPase [Candidatus Sumerlaeota bacterium]|nr:ArsA family ATPase [Candidatus Sumerlaeota bacterium]
MRVILYTGKGGVGKSSIASATAVRTAELGRRTLLVSSDLAHNLSDIFDARIGGEATTIADNLTVLEVDTLREIRENWSAAHEYFTDLLAYLGVENAVAEEVALYPGIDDAFLLSRILREIESDRYDVVIVDCSPTAGTLRHLTFSDSACTKMNRLIEIERKILKLVRPFAKKIKGVREIVPNDEVYGVFEELIGKVGRLGEILKDPEISSIRLVLNPDRIAIAETRRAFTYFGLFGFPVDAIVVNKVMPEALADGFLHDWYELQRGFLETIDQSFLDVAKLRVPLLDGEPVGLRPLSEMARGIYGERSPDEVLSPPKPVSLTRVGDEDRLVFSLPNVDKADLDIGRKDSELILTVGNHTRVYSLPDTLASREIGEARFADGFLTLVFPCQTAGGQGAR